MSTSYILIYLSAFHMFTVNETKTEYIGPMYMINNIDQSKQMQRPKWLSGVSSQNSHICPRWSIYYMKIINFKSLF